MASVIDGVRWAVLGGRSALYLRGLLLSVAVAAALLLTGVWFFRRTEKRFADVI
jgi:lipopolysaccharide transport system permease protein